MSGERMPIRLWNLMDLGGISKEGGTVLMLVWALNSMSLALTSDLALVVLKSLMPDNPRTAGRRRFYTSAIVTRERTFLKRLILDL